MPELCHIYTPILRTCSNQEYARLRRHTTWDLTRRKILFGVKDNEFIVKLDGGTLSSDTLHALKTAVEAIARHNNAFTDYREAKNFVARKNA